LPKAVICPCCSRARGFAIDCGHYLAEEAPDATAKALLDFFG
jgi:pimeloyl-ACP methyl ester carboxylesterase